MQQTIAAPDAKTADVTTAEIAGHAAPFLPFALPSIGEDEVAEVNEALLSGWLTTGPRTKEFERRFAEFVGAPHAIAVNSATAGLHLSLAALGVGPGDEVITTPLTFCATANVIVHLGATPVFADVGPDLNLDPGAVRARITPRTKAIMPVHFAGLPCDLAALRAIAREHDLAIVEDAAHAVGAAHGGAPIGATPAGTRDTVVFSFYATKNLTTGEGGMVVCADPELADRIRILSLHGISRDAWKRYTAEGSWYYEVTAPGYKYNMTDIQAALGLNQLRRFPGFQAERRRIVAAYDAAFAALPEVVGPPRAEGAGTEHAWHLYAIRLDLARLAISRADFIEALRARGIGASVHFIPVHLHPYYRDRFGLRRGDYPRAEAAYDGMVSLPLYPRMTDGDVARVVEAVRAIVAGARRQDSTGEMEVAAC
jgi:dTDP-4-amino-4,6-dideoxygalactose transaminase